MGEDLNISLNPITFISYPQSKRDDRQRIESMYLMRQISKIEFEAWLKQGGHNVR